MGQTEKREAKDSKVIDFYNLDVVIVVGYRVKSHHGTQFRIRAKRRLQEYVLTGFTIDGARLKLAD